MPLGKLNCTRSLLFYSPTLYLLSYGREYRSLFFYNLISVWTPLIPMQQELISVSSGISSHISQSCIQFLENVQRTRGWEWKYRFESDLWSPFAHAGGHHRDGRHWEWERPATPAPTRTAPSVSICWAHLTVIFLGCSQEPQNLSGALVMPPSHLTLE